MLLGCWAAPGLPPGRFCWVLDTWRAVPGWGWCALLARFSHQGVVQSGLDETLQDFPCAHQDPVGFVALLPILVCGRLVTSLLRPYEWYLPSY